MTLTITMTDDPAPNVRDAIGAPLGRFNDVRSGNPDISCPLALILSLPRSVEVIGGLWADTGWGYLHIEFLFVPESARGEGLGRTLMHQAEEEAIRRGCHSVWLDTFSFQARGFYEMLGYAVFGSLDDFPPGHSRFFMTKKLIPSAEPAA